MKKSREFDLLKGQSLKGMQLKIDVLEQNLLILNTIFTKRGKNSKTSLKFKIRKDGDILIDFETTLENPLKKKVGLPFLNESSYSI